MNQLNKENQKPDAKFASGFCVIGLPFNGDNSLSRVSLSLSIVEIPFRATICPFQRQ